MGHFSYVARDRSGKSVSGIIAATSETDARQKLRLMGMNVRSLRQGNAGTKGPLKLGLGVKRQSVSGSELAVVTKQISVMIDAGVAIVQSLTMLAAQTHNPYLKEVLIQVRTSVEGGADLATAMEKHPRVFDSLYVSLVRAGSAAGQLDVMMRRLSVYIEKANKLKKQLVSALTYPAIVVVIALAMTIVMLLFVVPMFAKNYTEAGKELPGLTQMVIDMSDWLQSNFHFIIAGAVGAAIVFKRWVATPKGRYQFDLLLLKVPLFGSLVTKISIARFSSTMATLISSGIAIIEALQVCAKASGNLVLEKEIMTIKEDVSRGRGLSAPMGKSRWFPPMVSGMVAIGEASGRLDGMLEKISNFYEDEVDSAMAAIMKLIEPVMFVVIGGIVGFILIAMYLPVFDLASTAGP